MIELLAFNELIDGIKGKLIKSVDDGRLIILRLLPDNAATSQRLVIERNCSAEALMMSGTGTGSKSGFSEADNEDDATLPLSPEVQRGVSSGVSIPVAP